MIKKKVYVTQPSLPNLRELNPFLKKIWQNKILTNGGPFHQQFESKLCKFLKVPYVSLVSNGTLGLIVALKALNLREEVITSPYSFIATANSIVWNNLKPVFVDIDPVTLNLDPAKIKSAITKNTSAILPVHVYGNPCDTDQIQSIAKQYQLKVIYDASHAFGINYKNKSIFNYGDLSVVSFHATKIFNTFEGGAIICKSKKIKLKIDQIKNFGLSGVEDLTAIGLNAKMNEFSAGLGLLQLKKFKTNVQKRKKIDRIYRNGLNNIPGITCYEFTKGVNNNHSYFPIFVDENYFLTRDQLFLKLKKNGIIARKYFYPLISEFKIFKKKNFKNNYPIANRIANSVICLPIYEDLDLSIVHKIIKIILG